MRFSKVEPRLKLFVGYKVIILKKNIKIILKRNSRLQKPSLEEGKAPKGSSQKIHPAKQTQRKRGKKTFQGRIRQAVLHKLEDLPRENRVIIREVLRIMGQDELFWGYVIYQQRQLHESYIG